MTQALRRRVQVLASAALIAACAGPTPSGPPPSSASPDPTVAAVASPTAFPSVATTIEPDPTPEGASPPRTEIEVNANIVNRPGVPDSLKDRYWWTESDVGLLGTTAQLGVPAGEWIVDASDGLVVSTRDMRESAPRALIVRDFATGAVVLEVATDLLGIVDAKLVGRRLFWTGAGGECNDDRVDAGVWTIDVESGQDPLAIVEPGRVVGCGIAGRRLELSPSRATLGAIYNSYGEPNWMDVIDVATLEHRYRIDDVWPWTLTDDTFLQWDHKFTDGMAPGLGGITAYGLRTGAVRWRFPQAGNRDRFSPRVESAIGSTFVVQYFWATAPRSNDLVLATFDPATGERRILLTQPDTSSADDLRILQPELSSATHLVLGQGTVSEDVRARAYAVVNMSSGSVRWDAFVIDPPWLCFSEHCFRD